MYEVRFVSSRVEKRSQKLFKKVSLKVKQRLKFTLEAHPYPSQSYGSALCKIEKKGHVYGYEITGGDRILFDIIEPEKVVMILFAGNDDEEKRWLKLHA